ncbi:hypothetical protein N7535_003492 [Penicillium sp. DV-2018c]|nr:hypothetical protein N7461_000806 [Penicillium sp. DV-2018c]KAJ5576566.1 hypothetical protein N7535_003492 [Penicillium sp. DV-2018c]
MANPRWDEITRELRVFELKKKDPIQQLGKQDIFGPTTSRFWTIEYQKRPLPHCHLLLFLAHADQFHSPAMINELVSAQLPDP